MPEFIRVGIDTGGTFTDFVVARGTRLTSFKVSSTPHNPAQAILEGLARDGELTISQLAERFGISDGTIYAWIENRKLAARRGPANRLYIPFPPEVEQHCRHLVASSVHLPAETKIRAAGGAV